MVLETRGGVSGGKGKAGAGRRTEPDWVVGGVGWRLKNASMLWLRNGGTGFLFFFGFWQS